MAIGMALRHALYLYQAEPSEYEMTEEKLSDIGKLILRVGLGIVFIAHGQLKVFVFGLPHAAEVFIGHGVPGWTAYPAAFIEIVGGTMLILGLGTRLAAPLLFCIGFGAGWVHIQNGWNYTSPPNGRGSTACS